MDDKLVQLSDVETELLKVTERYTVAHEANGTGRVVWSDNLISVNCALNAVRSIPAVDAVEVCRCKDCRYFCKGQNEVEAWEWCDVWKKDCWSDCYCASGQRREDGDGDG